MSQILLAAAIPGAVFLFILIKTGLRLLIPFAICVVVGMVGMMLFVWASATPIDASHPEFAINPVSVAAALMVTAAAFGVLLVGVVMIARWYSGEYTNVKEGHER